MTEQYSNFEDDEEEKYWRKKAEQQENRRNLFILIIGIASLAWIFNTELTEYSIKAITLYQKNFPIRIKETFPESSSIIQHVKSTEQTASFTVITENSKDKNCLIKLETWNEKIPTLEIFVRAGERAETRLMPLGEYRAKIACGKEWIDKKNLFGPRTTISVGITPLKFWKDKGKITGQILTLSKEINGNFRTEKKYYTDY